MPRFSVDIPDELNTWLTEQARLNHRSKNGQLEHILSTACKMPFFNYEKRYTPSSPLMCHSGHHYFVKDDPAMGDFCNCGVFMLGEVI